MTNSHICFPSNVSSPSNQVASNQQRTIIFARRTKDDYITVDLSIPHIIEQTILRSLRSKNFRKSIIQVIDDDSEQSQSTLLSGSHKRTYEEMLTGSKHEDNQYTMQLMKQESTHSSNDFVEDQRSDESVYGTGGCDYLSQDGQILLKQLTWDSKPTQSIKTDLLSPIPTSWIQRGVTSEERKKFQRSIDNASLCPYQAKRFAVTKQRHTDDIKNIKTCNIKWPSHPVGGHVLAPDSTRINIKQEPGAIPSK